MAGIAKDQTRWRFAAILPVLAAGLAAKAAVLTVANTADSGPGSLRQALIDANAASEKDYIVFNIPGAGVQTVNLLYALPQVTSPVDIDGTTQPGYAGTPLIELNGASAGSTANGLLLLGGSNRVCGLAINRFGRDGIRIENAGNNVIEGNMVGSGPQGTNTLGNTDGGITIYQSSANRIGGLTAASRNVLSGGNLAGVYIIGVNSLSNRVVGNLIGTDASGTHRLGNRQNGVVISEGRFNCIGGVTAGSQNVISGNTQSGVYVMGVNAISNVIQGNLIGTDITGRYALSNAGDGITINGAAAVQVGGTAPGARNLVSGNGQRGVQIVGAGATNNRVCGNWIGLDSTGTKALSNGYAGIAVAAASRNLIGEVDPAARNVISGNGQSGVALMDYSHDNFVRGNYLGTTPDGRYALGNQFSGVMIYGPSNIVGGCTANAGNLISGNLQHGVYIHGPGAIRNQVSGNQIGTDYTGRSAVTNLASGVLIEQASDNLIGGASAGARNVISGNSRGYGVLLLGTNATRNVVSGNYVGTDISGKLALANNYGIGLNGAPSNQIGGTTLEMRNLISANLQNGLCLFGGTARANVIQGNYVGTDLDGSTALPNRMGGIYLYGVAANQIGGAQPGTGNLVSGNYLVGISIGDPGAVGNIVQGNYLGTKADGVSMLGNVAHNIELLNGASDTQVGGTESGAGNRIAYCQTALYAGVRLRDGGVGNQVRGNAVFGNAGLGIDLGANGVSLTNLPTLTVSSGRYLTTVQGNVTGYPTNRSLNLDFYHNSQTDPSIYGEGDIWLGAATVFTDGSGNAGFTVVVTNRVALTGYVTATISSATMNTTEFARCLVNQSTIAPDSDGDGMPDDYEAAWGFNPLNSADGKADADGDGAGNTAEYRAGTNPRNLADVLCFRQLVLGGGQSQLSFQTVAGRKYAVEYADSLQAGWHPLLTNLAGSGGVTWASDTNGASIGMRLYRVTSSP